MFALLIYYEMSLSLVTMRSLTYPFMPRLPTCVWHYIMSGLIAGSW